MTHSLEFSIIKSDEDNSFYGLISKYPEVIFLFIDSAIYVCLYKRILMLILMRTSEFSWNMKVLGESKFQTHLFCGIIERRQNRRSHGDLS